MKDSDYGGTGCSAGHGSASVLVDCPRAILVRMHYASY
jgi:hypothetical protein